MVILEKLENNHHLSLSEYFAEKLEDSNRPRLALKKYDDILKLDSKNIEDGIDNVFCIIPIKCQVNSLNDQQICYNLVEKSIFV